MILVDTMDTDYKEIEKNLLERAVDAVYREAGIRLILNNMQANGEIHYDAAIQVEGYEHLRFTAEVKQWAQQANLGVLINQIQQLPVKGMLVADYVNPKMADKLRELDVPFIDAVGNVYINEKPLYICIKGIKNNPRNDIVHTIREAQTRGRAFQPKGIKVVYALMRDPELVAAPYRDIVNVTGVALGTVGWVINDLKQAGYLVEYGKSNRQLKNKKELLDKWVDAYLEKLRPKLFLGTFSTDNDYWWMDLDNNIVEYDAKWGGEVAAAKMTWNIKPEKIIIYLAKEGGKQLLAENHLHKDPKGNIQIYRAFWDDEEKRVNQFLTDMNEFMGCVNPIIVYADLLATGDPRNLETARILYDEKLAGFVRED